MHDTVIQVHNYLMCVSKAWFRYLLSSGYLCPTQDCAILGLQKKLQHVGKGRKEDVPQKELVSGIRNPCLACNARRCLSVRGFALIYRDL